ncbi:MAG TPA: prepilin peptidase [Rhizomicrobium sp.]|nr:prepilin peptidase [Rhizomicrobium sp.]
MIAYSLVFLVLPMLLIAAAAWDLASFTIPNTLQVMLLAGFALFAACTQMSPMLFGEHLLAGFIGLAAGFTLFALGYVGGGDAKFFACLSLWLGLHDFTLYALVASIFGGGLTLALIAAREVPLPGFLASQGWILRLHDEREGIPYGVALAAGAFFILPQAEIFRTAIGG